MTGWFTADDRTSDHYCSKCEKNRIYNMSFEIIDNWLSIRLRCRKCRSIMRHVTFEGKIVDQQ